MRGTAYGLLVLALSFACGGRTSLSEGELDGTGGSGTAGGNGTGGPSAASLDVVCGTPCSNQIFAAANSCKLCHGAAAKLGGLDLESPGRAARLKDAPAKHLDIEQPDARCPVGDKLIDSTNVDNSWLLKKINGMQGTCGLPMPLGGVSTGADRQCLSTWVRCVAAN